MKTITEIKERLVEVEGSFRDLCNKEALNLSLSCEEYQVLDNLAVERDILKWVLSGSA